MATNVSFDCRICRKPATVIEGFETVSCVYCPACGHAVDAGAAADMHETLLDRYRRERALHACDRKGRRPGQPVHRRSLTLRHDRSGAKARPGHRTSARDVPVSGSGFQPAERIGQRNHQTILPRRTMAWSAVPSMPRSSRRTSRPRSNRDSRSTSGRRLKPRLHWRACGAFP